MDIRTIINSIKLYFKIALRFLLILFRKERRIIELYFDSGNESLFEDSFLIIKYRFKNAIYYKVNNKLTLENQIKIFNVKNINTAIPFIVYGWFEKKHYLIEVQPEKTLNSKSFKTQINNLKISIIPNEVPKLIPNHISINTKTISVNTPKVFVGVNKVQIKTNSFTQNDFL
ncbi:hypothetical protein [Flavobacterium sp.]|uniref:hypothetical protein n=1 Tax=Flavobacterium sp. TaxID=239 RepID=UPI00261D76BD|nr:hypothetical protein [Flavobacterium sp.]MDD3005842.1 hypothetical protein [Flavobacterium sp.]